MCEYERSLGGWKAGVVLTREVCSNASRPGLKCASSFSAVR